MKIILASQSPRRKEILKDLGYSFLVVPSLYDEHIELANGIDQGVETLALEKAKSVQKNNPDAIIVAADTIVVLDGRILGKPKSKQEAIDMLIDLSGREHEVKTGVCISSINQDITFCETTKVYFKDLEDDSILNYVDSGKCMDKAGSYGIQECDFVDKIEGSYSNVVGLPKEKTKDILEFIRSESDC